MYWHINSSLFMVNFFNRKVIVYQPIRKWFAVIIMLGFVQLLFIMTNKIYLFPLPPLLKHLYLHWYLIQWVANQHFTLYWLYLLPFLNIYHSFVHTYIAIMEHNIIPSLPKDIKDSLIYYIIAFAGVYANWIWSFVKIFKFQG